MVTVQGKAYTARRAVARAVVTLPPLAATALADSQHSLSQKGDALSVAQLAGILASKRTSELIPLCHQVPLDVCLVDIRTEDNCSRVVIDCEARATHATGVEMEAMVGASTAALTMFAFF